MIYRTKVIFDGSVADVYQTPTWLGRIFRKTSRTASVGLSGTYPYFHWRFRLTNQRVPYFLNNLLMEKYTTNTDPPSPWKSIPEARLLDK